MSQKNPSSNDQRFMSSNISNERNTREKARNKEQSVLVVGGAGYVGSVLSNSLLTAGYNVKVLDKLLYNNGFSISRFLDDPNFSFILGDFRDEKILEKSLENVSNVVILAALVGDPISRKYPELTLKINQEGTIKLLNYLKDKNIQKVVFASTCSNYGLKEGNSLATEESELNPQSLYAKTKVAVEKYIIENKGEFDYCPTILRIATAYGISGRMRFDLTISEFTRELALGKELVVYDPDTWRPYCHIRDISKAIIQVIEAPRERVDNEIFNVGKNEENYTKRMVVDTIIKYVTNANVKYQTGGKDPRNYRVSFDKIKSRLNFEPDFTVKSYTKKLYEAIKSGFFLDIETQKSLYGNYEVNDNN